MRCVAIWIPITQRKNGAFRPSKQALEKLLKAELVLRNIAPPRTHELRELAFLLNQSLPEEQLKLQVFAVEARYQEGPFALPASREVLLQALECRLSLLEQAIAGTQP